MVEFVFLLVDAVRALYERSSIDDPSMPGDSGKPPCLRGVLIPDSRILGWQWSSSSVSFLIGASIWPGHPEYQPPSREQWGRACYKRAHLTFEGIQDAKGLIEQGQVHRVLNSHGFWDYGPFDLDTSAQGGFHIMGRFGDVNIHGGTMRFVIEKTPEEERESLKKATYKRYRRITYMILGLLGVATLAWLVVGD